MIDQEQQQSEPASHSLADAARAASCRDDVVAAVEALYGRVQLEIDRRRPLCVVSGRCCRFEEFGHRLYVTTLEMAHFLRRLPPAAAPAPNPGGCPFQVNKLCTVHPIRPFGCRIFFCDAAALEWQNRTYEHFHADLKRLHESLAVPYFYVEWRHALDLVHLPASPANAVTACSDGQRAGAEE